MKSLKSCTVLVTATSYGKDDPRLRQELEEKVGRVIYNLLGRPLSSQEMASHLVGCDGCIAGLDWIDHPALQHAVDLKVIARYGVGVDRVDLQAASQAGIIVTNTPGANAVSVAELTIGLMISLARSIPQADSATKAGGWPRLGGLAIEGKTVGLLGFGAIGRQVAKRLQGFDCVVIAHDLYPDLEFAVAHQVRLVPLSEVIASSDFLSLHLPVTPETRLIVNQAFLESMKPGAFLINTARGELIDEVAVAAALQSGRLRGAAFDTFNTEPPAADNPLLGFSQVIATPHTGAHSDSATNAMGRQALEDCLAVLSGQPPRFPVV